MSDQSKFNDYSDRRRPIATKKLTVIDEDHDHATEIEIDLVNDLLPSIRLLLEG